MAANYHKRSAGLGALPEDGLDRSLQRLSLQIEALRALGQLK